MNTTEVVKSYCVECHQQNIEEERDIVLCKECSKKYDLEKVWKLHDKGKLDALDMNESQGFRDRFLK